MYARCVLRYFQQYFGYIVAAIFSDGKWGKWSIREKNLPQIANKLKFNIQRRIQYISPLVGI